MLRLSCGGGDELRSSRFLRLRAAQPCPDLETVMKPVHIHGIGAVSPAGWGVEPMREALRRGEPLPVKAMPRPGWTEMLQVRQVPVPASRPAFLSHARLRRTSPIAHYTVAAALEAVGNDAGKCAAATV